MSLALAARANESTHILHYSQNGDAGLDAEAKLLPDVGESYFLRSSHHHGSVVRAALEELCEG